MPRVLEDSDDDEVDLLSSGACVASQTSYEPQILATVTLAPIPHSTGSTGDNS